MADRADHLARTLLARLANLHARLAEDGGDAPDRAQRIAAIEKVLAVELGVTDGATLSLIEAAAPRVTAPDSSSDREVAAFAEFLRRRLASAFEE